MGDQDELAGRIAAVTGAGSGLGAAMSRRFAEAGMAVAALDIDEAAARATAATLADDVRRADDGGARSTSATPRRSPRRRRPWRQALGGCDVVCANVGVQQFGAIDRLTDDDWTWVLNVNVLGTVRTVAAFLPLLRRASRASAGSSSTASSGVLVPGERLGAYQTSKFAVCGLRRGVAARSWPPRASASPSSSRRG